MKYLVLYRYFSEPDLIPIAIFDIKEKAREEIERNMAFDVKKNLHIIYYIHYIYDELMEEAGQS